MSENGGNNKLVMPDFEEDYLQTVLSAIGHPEARKDIQLTGYIVNTDLPAIINQCEVFLYPSLRESFGIPILEGMACGAPVITSNTSSMPEIAGDAALLVDPFNPQEIKNAIQKVIHDEKFRQELKEKGFKQASKFSWENMARQYLNLYKEVYNDLKSQKK